MPVPELTPALAKEHAALREKLFPQVYTEHELALMSGAQRRGNTGAVFFPYEGGMSARRGRAPGLSAVANPSIRMPQPIDVQNTAPNVNVSGDENKITIEVQLPRWNSLGLFGEANAGLLDDQTTDYLEDIYAAGDDY